MNKATFPTDVFKANQDPNQSFDLLWSRSGLAYAVS
jgi:hypothetical protein